MSDFGTTISVVKKNKSVFSDNEIKELSDKLAELIKKNKYENALAEKFKHEFVLDESKSQCIVQLSEHYYGGDDDEDMESFEFVEDVELETAEEIVELLKDIFPDYTFEACTEEW